MKNYNSNKFLIPSFLIFLSVIFMSIGYASMSSITGYVLGKSNVTSGEGLFITNTTIEESSSASGKVNSYYNTLMGSDIILSDKDKDSYITIKVTIYNKTNDKYTYIGTNYDHEFYTNSHIIFNVSLEPYDIDNSSISPKESIDLYITFKYEDNIDLNMTSNELTSYLNYKFVLLKDDFNVKESCSKQDNTTAALVDYPGCTLNTWTNGNFTLTVLPNTEEEIISYSFDDGLTWQESPSKEFTENTTAIIRTKNKEGINSSAKEIVIDHIDKTNPTINGVSDKKFPVTIDEDNTIESLTNAYITDEGGSGINKTEIYLSRKEEGTTTRIDNTNYFKDVGLYCVTLVATDYAGNYTKEDTKILVRWPTGGKYILKWTQLRGNGLVGEGKATDTSKKGLYKDNQDTALNSTLPYTSKYYYSGSTVDNYLTFMNLEMRILFIAVNDTIKIIAPRSGSSTDWDTRYIYDSDKYEDWTVKWPNGKYIYTDESDRVYYTDTDASHLSYATFYAGRFARNASDSLADTINNERTSNKELSNKLSSYTADFQSYFAFPNVSDYIKACNDQNTIYNIRTTQTNQASFKNNSYLHANYQQWTLNAKRATSTDNDFWTYNQGTSGDEIVSQTRYYNARYRPVMYLKADTIISGSGSSTDTFKVEESWDWFDNTMTSCK